MLPNKFRKVQSRHKMISAQPDPSTKLRKTQEWCQTCPEESMPKGKIIQNFHLHFFLIIWYGAFDSRKREKKLFEFFLWKGFQFFGSICLHLYFHGSWFVPMEIGKPNHYFGEKWRLQNVAWKSGRGDSSLHPNTWGRWQKILHLVPTHLCRNIRCTNIPKMVS